MKFSKHKILLKSFLNTRQLHSTFIYEISIS